MEINSKNDMPAFMDNDLEPYTLIHDIVCNWWVIILGAIAGALLTYVVVSSRYVPEYTTQATFVVASKADANGYNNLPVIVFVLMLAKVSIYITLLPNIFPIKHIGPAVCAPVVII